MRNKQITIGVLIVAILFVAVAIFNVHNKKSSTQYTGINPTTKQTVQVNAPGNPATVAADPLLINNLPSLINSGIGYSEFDTLTKFMSKSASMKYQQKYSTSFIDAQSIKTSTIDHTKTTTYTLYMGQNKKNGLVFTITDLLDQGLYNFVVVDSSGQKINSFDSIVTRD
jgi:hypothetical protein